MIKAEVFFDGNRIVVGEYVIEVGFQFCMFNVYLDGCFKERLNYLDDAIKYCLEH